MCVMYVSYWKALGSLALTTSKTNLQAFYGHKFVPKGVLQNFSIELGGKTIHVDVKVVDTTLDYNLLPGYSWFYAMTVVISSIFHLLCFPQEGKIVTIDQLDYCVPSTQVSTTGNSVPLTGDHHGQFQSVGMGLFKSSSLIGVFP